MSNNKNINKMENLKMITKIVISIKGTNVKKVCLLSPNAQIQYSGELESYGTSGFKNHIRRIFRKQLIEIGGMEMSQLPFWSIKVDLIF